MNIAHLNQPCVLRTRRLPAASCAQMHTHQRGHPHTQPVSPEAREVDQGVGGCLPASRQEVQVPILVSFQVLQIILRYRGGTARQYR